MGDVYTGMRVDWLYRQHINKVRKRLKQLHKAEGQLNLKLVDKKHDKKKANGKNGAHS